MKTPEERCFSQCGPTQTCWKLLSLLAAAAFLEEGKDAFDARLPGDTLHGAAASLKGFHMPRPESDDSKGQMEYQNRLIVVIRSQKRKEKNNRNKSFCSATTEIKRLFTGPRMSWYFSFSSFISLLYGAGRKLLPSSQREVQMTFGASSSLLLS